MNIKWILSFLLRLPVMQATVITASSSYLLSGTLNLTAATVSVVIVFYVYVKDRIEDHEEDDINSTPATVLIQNHSTLFDYLSKFAIATYSVLLFNESFKAFSESEIISATGIVCFTLLPLFSFYLHKRLKPYLLVDSVNIAIGWASTFVAIPYFLTDSSQVTEASILFVLWVVIIVAGAELININDVVGDRRAGKQTLPTMIGALETERTAFMSLLLCYGFLYAVQGITAGTVLATVYPVLLIFLNWRNLPLQRPERVSSDS